MLSVLFSVYLFIVTVISILPGDHKNINKMLIVTFLLSSKMKLLPKGKLGLSIKHYKLAKGQNETSGY